MSLGDTVKTQRLKLQLTQRELAIRAQLSQAEISRIESHKTLQLKSNATKRLAAALAVTVDFLLDKDQRMNEVDVLRSDPTAREVMDTYIKLDADTREHVLNYMRFMVSQNPQVTV